MIRNKIKSIPEFSKEYKTFRRISRRAILMTMLMVIIFMLRYIHYLFYCWGILDQIFANNEYRMTGESAVRF